MSRFEVDSARVVQASAAVRASATAIGTETDAMMRNLLDLQSSWRGSAASSFQHLAADWRATQERVRRSLEEIQQALAAAGQQYREVEEQATRAFSR